MKQEIIRLDEYISAQDVEMINEGFWNSIKRFFGFIGRKFKEAWSGLNEPVQIGVTATQSTAAPLIKKDPKVKEAIKNQAKAVESGDNKELLKKVKIEVDRLSRSIDDLSDEALASKYSVSQWMLLRDLSEELNDSEGKKQAEEFLKMINEKWPKFNPEKQSEELIHKVKLSPMYKQAHSEKNDTEDDTSEKIELPDGTKETLASKYGKDLKAVEDFTGVNFTDTWNIISAAYNLKLEGKAELEKIFNVDNKDDAAKSIALYTVVMMCFKASGLRGEEFKSNIGTLCGVMKQADKKKKADEVQQNNDKNNDNNE